MQFSLHKRATLPLALVCVSLLAANAAGDDVRLDWVSEGFSTKLGFYRPAKVDLSPNRPVRVGSVPVNVAQPLFGTMFFGSRESAVGVIVLLDEPETGPARLWIDSNGNGDLTDDPPVQWTARQTTGKNGPITVWNGSASIPVTCENEKRALAIKLYRFATNNSQSQQRNALFYYLDCGFSGTISCGGKNYAAALVDHNARGDFSTQNSGVSLLIDLNNNGKFESPGESFNLRKPFNIGGTTYEVAGATGGGNFQLVKSSQSVAEIPVPSPPETGTNPIAFTKTSSTGQSIHFPSDYRGKLVMVDFWATWCGPCRAEIPNLTNVYEEFHPKGFEVIGVSLDNDRSLPNFDKFITDNHITWPQICNGMGLGAELAQQYGVRGIPAAWLVDGVTGQVVAEGNELRGARLRPTIERCLANLGKTSASRPAAGSQGRTDVATTSGSRAFANPSATAQTSTAVAPASGKPAVYRPSPDSKLRDQTLTKFGPEDPLVAKVRKLAKAGKLLTFDNFSSKMRSPTPAPISAMIADTSAKPIIPPPSAEPGSDLGLVIADKELKPINFPTDTGIAVSSPPLRVREIADRAAQAYVRAGWIYHCTKCDHWHVKIAGGYAIANDTIVTAYHVMRPPDTTKQGEGYPVVIRGNDECLSIVGVLAADELTDAVVLRLATTDLSPLAFATNTRIGDAAYCFSDPRGERGYFSNGIVNRFYTRPGGVANNPADQRLNVSTDWAPGSSGAAILDDSANVIGHVTRIKPLFGNRLSDDSAEHGQSAATLMNLHEAIPATSVLKLIENTNRTAHRSPLFMTAALSPAGPMSGHPKAVTAEDDRTKFDSLKPALPAAASATEPPKLTLQAILIDGKSREAMINGVNVKEGDDVAGARVVTINTKLVKLQFQNHEIVLQNGF